MDKRTTVFIADSAEEFSSALSTALQRSDAYQVVGTADDGERTIQKVLQLKPDVLILDLMLSKKDGISALKAISGMDKQEHPGFHPLQTDRSDTSSSRTWWSANVLPDRWA